MCTKMKEHDLDMRSDNEIESGGKCSPVRQPNYEFILQLTMLIIVNVNDFSNMWKTQMKIF